MRPQSDVWRPTAPPREISAEYSWAVGTKS